MADRDPNWRSSSSRPKATTPSRTDESNIAREEQTVLKALATNQDTLILPADKAKRTVVLDREQYDKKVQDLLGDTNIYMPLKKDPTSKFQKEIHDVLKRSEEKVLDRVTYLRLNPTSTTEQPPAFYGLPKIHKPGVPLQPIVPSIGSVTYNLTGHLAKILGPLVGKSQHHVQNSADFVHKIKDINVAEDEIITSYDVCSLFTKEAVSVVMEALQADDTLADRTNLSVDHIYTKTIIEKGGNLQFEVYRKPTHTDQYLAFDSHHPLEHKLAVIKTQDNVITSDEAKTYGHRHLRAALAKCGYQDWTFIKGLKPSD
ncbi:uncharacterized protein [Branchiostoma lanceolatum]|uniref:uncharacterized protein n=1 Tax=Branchiostoma lanceolatum TaxID=7740 RepID=UPI0034565A96